MPKQAYTVQKVTAKSIPDLIINEEELSGSDRTGELIAPLRATKQLGFALRPNAWCHTLKLMTRFCVTNSDPGLKKSKDGNIIYEKGSAPAAPATKSDADLIWGEIYMASTTPEDFLDNCLKENPSGTILHFSSLKAFAEKKYKTKAIEYESCKPQGPTPCWPSQEVSGDLRGFQNWQDTMGEISWEACILPIPFHAGGFQSG
ncbi:hypothetical protein EYC80_007826 [Monilinia laxa]|uniref:Uncharacterized protein n=1 Tax=Monilinia laxa TaxID=61186 RepID=A0A5N6JV87_MONLA|nr:hypothetical protein EYC80_007826 [Monilinia laxa]